MNIEQLNKSEQSRLKDMIKLSGKNLEHKRNLETDIDLLKTNPGKYWNSFRVPQHPKKSEQSRISFIKVMKSVYSKQLNLF